MTTPLVMTTVQSYTTTKSGGQQHQHQQPQPPRKVSAVVTGTLFLLFLIVSEQCMRGLFYVIRHCHPILDDETNRYILARHVGVDALSCTIVALLGYGARHVAWDMVTATINVIIGGSNNNNSTIKSKKSSNSSSSGAMALGGYEQRIFTYHPAAFRIALFFFTYQVKNLYDTVAWGDGWEFVFHHLCSMVASYGAMYPSFGHFYAVFFLGLSEISTAVLCILANFDDDHGVVGLGDAFPLTKVAIGTLFVVLFILCRTIMWPIATYFFMRDATTALKQARQHGSDGNNNNGSNPRLNACRAWMKLFMVCLTGLSVLQVLWLGQIFIIAKKEFEAIGLL